MYFIGDFEFTEQSRWRIYSLIEWLEIMIFPLSEFLQNGVSTTFKLHGTLFLFLFLQATSCSLCDQVGFKRMVHQRVVNFITCLRVLAFCTPKYNALMFIYCHGNTHVCWWHFGYFKMGKYYLLHTNLGTLFGLKSWHGVTILV